MDDVANGREPLPIPLILSTQDADYELAVASLGDLQASFTYSPTLVLPEALALVDESQDYGCSCELLDKGTSCAVECECAEEFGCFYTPDGRMELDHIPRRGALYECSSACGCKGRCRNSVIQQGVRQQLAVRWILQKGFGLFCTTDIRKGQFLCLYAGEVISTPEARKRWTMQKNDSKSNYILVMREVSISSKDGTEHVSKTTIDPRYRGNLGRFMNHACPPLATHIMLSIRLAGSIIPLPALFAARDISAGQELTWDYGDASGEGWYYGRDESEVATSGNERLRCGCGSPRCRGWIPYDESL